MKQNQTAIRGWMPSSHISTEGPRASINQPSLQNRLNEALKWSGELDGNLRVIQAQLFGECPEDKNNQGVPTVEAKVAVLCTRLAAFCGFTSTIIHRIEET